MYECHQSASSRSGVHKLVLHHREEGLGISLSGGNPPVTVTHVLTGGIAESAGVQVGDIVLDINGLNCRKKVDVSRLVELKVPIQQFPGEKDDSQDFIDVRNQLLVTPLTNKYSYLVMNIVTTHTHT